MPVFRRAKNFLRSGSFLAPAQKIFAKKKKFFKAGEILQESQGDGEPGFDRSVQPG